MVKKLQALRAKKGFTLVELIVVIAIIGVLAAILVPVMMGQVTKAKINSLDSTASTVVTTVNTWIADRYTHGKSDADDGAYTAAAGSLAGSGGKWSIDGAADDETSLTFALQDAYNFAGDDYVKFWIEKGKCVAAVFVQGEEPTNVEYEDRAWSGIEITNEKDGIVNISDGDKSMIGTSPKMKAAADDAG